MTRVFSRYPMQALDRKCSGMAVNGDASNGSLEESVDHCLKTATVQFPFARCPGGRTAIHRGNTICVLQVMIYDCKGRLNGVWQ